MRDIELANKLIKWLQTQYDCTQIFPRRFTAHETAEAVGGVATRVGIVSGSVVAELRGRGINIVYCNSSSPRIFLIDKFE